MKAKILIAAASGALALQLQSAHARIGESESQIESRYGNWIPPLAGHGFMAMKMYRKGEMTIGVIYVDGVSEGELYQKSKKGPFTDREIELLMAANSDGRKWTLVDDGQIVFGSKTWARHDSAVCVSRDKSVMITTACFQEMNQAETKLQEDARLSGF